MGAGVVSLASRGGYATGGWGIACDSPLGGHLFERAHASEFVSASARRVFAEGTGANAPAQTVEPSPQSPPRPTPQPNAHRTFNTIFPTCASPRIRSTACGN